MDSQMLMSGDSSAAMSRPTPQGAGRVPLVAIPETMVRGWEKRTKG
jgi:hypothetical protein